MNASSLHVGVIGAGSWGTALATLLAHNGHHVALWVYEEDVCSTIRTKRENNVYLPGFVIPESVVPTQSIEEVSRDKPLVVSAVPSHLVRTVLTKAVPYFDAEAILVSVSKGIENETLKTIAGVFTDILPSSCIGRTAYLSGPSFAKEVAQQLPTAVVAAAQNEQVAAVVQQAFSSEFFRVYTSTDVVGVELGGALKNVIAVAAGCSDGLGFGHNTRAALITRGLAEMSRLGVERGAHPLTFAGLSGMGDLVLTCTGALSRNRTVGVKLGEGMALEEIVSSTKMVAEGVKTTKSAYELSQRHKVEMPIVDQVYAILYHNKDPREAVTDLMGRSLRDELDKQ